MDINDDRSVIQKDESLREEVSFSKFCSVITGKIRSVYNSKTEFMRFCAVLLQTQNCPFQALFGLKTKHKNCLEKKKKI